MKVAFDVQGTLEGYARPQVIRLARAFIELGCELSVWSFGGRQMARDACFDAGLHLYGHEHANRITCLPKRTKDYGWKDDPDYRPSFDLCVDDDHSSAPGLDATMVLYVEDIPTEEAEIVALAERLSKAFPKN